MERIERIVTYSIHHTVRAPRKYSWQFEVASEVFIGLRQELDHINVNHILYEVGSTGKFVSTTYREFEEATKTVFNLRGPLCWHRLLAHFHCYQKRNMLYFQHWSSEQVAFDQDIHSSRILSCCTSSSSPRTARLFLLCLHHLQHRPQKIYGLTSQNRETCGETQSQCSSLCTLYSTGMGWFHLQDPLKWQWYRPSPTVRKQNIKRVEIAF